MNDQVSKAKDPNTGPAALQELAQDQALQAVVAGNPAAYPQLLEWLKEWGTPEAQEIAAARLATTTGATTSPAAPTPTSGGFSSATDSSVPSPPDDRTVLSSRPSGRGSRSGAASATGAAGAGLAGAGAAASATPPGSAGSSVLGAQAGPPSVPTSPPLSGGTTSRYTPQTGTSQAQNAGQTRLGGTPSSLPPTPKASKQGLGEGLPLWAWAAMGAGAALIIGMLLWFFVLSPKDDSSTAASTEDVAISEDEEGTNQEEAADGDNDEDVGEVVEEDEEPELQEPEIDYSLEPIAPTINFPAPPDHVEASWFVSADKSMACEMGSTLTACTIYDYSFNVNEGGCGSGPATIVLDLDGVRWDCSFPEVSRTNNDQAPILSASTASASGMDACLSTIGGMSCWNTFTGYSFALSPYGWVEGNDGVIPENRFPWIDKVDRR